MFRSLADYDVSALSPRSAETLQEIAIPLSEGAAIEELQARLGKTREEINARLESLGAELDAQSGGAVIRPLTPAEYEALRESIREHGQIVPALVDASGAIITGHNRKRACDELGIKLRKVTYRGPEDRMRDVALAENFVRRHLKASDRRRAVIAELKCHPDRSDRAIAAIIGVSPTTVGKAREELEREGQVSILDTRTGKDGKQQSAARPERAPRNPETRLEYIVEELRSLPALEDREIAHARADELLVEAVRLLGGHGIAQAWEQSGPRYYRQ